MSLPYKMNKKHIYKWRKANMPRVLEINKKSNRKSYAWQKIQRIFVNILFEFQRSFRKNEINYFSFKFEKKKILKDNKNYTLKKNITKKH